MPFWVAHGWRRNLFKTGKNKSFVAKSRRRHDAHLRGGAQTATNHVAHSISPDPSALATKSTECRRKTEVSSPSPAWTSLNRDGSSPSWVITEGDRQLRRLARDLDRKTGLCRKQGALADAQQRVQLDQRRWTEVREEIVERKKQLVEDAEVKAGLAAFEPVWESLTPAEQWRLLHLLIEEVVYDGKDSTIAVTFRPTGIKELAESCGEGSE